MKSKLFKVVFIFVVIFSSYSFAEAEQLDLSKDENGWTVPSASTDSDVVYVDSVSGNDLTCRSYRTADVEMGSDPFNPAGAVLPCATSAKAATLTSNSSPDWILFKRGSVFDTGIVYSRSGRSMTEPAVLAAYGSSGEMPVFRGGYSNNGNVNTHYLAIIGLDFYADYRDPASPNYLGDTNNDVGLWFFSHEQYSMKGILVEGCKFRFFKDNAFQPVNQTENSGLTIRRSLFLNNYSVSSSHSQGLLVSNFSDVLLEDNVFDHNGWLVQNDSDGVEEVGEATIFNHNIYFTNNKNLTIKNNIFSRGSSNNSKIKYTETGIGTGLVVDNNLYIGGEIAVSIGAPDEHDVFSVVNPLVTNNIFLNPGYANPTNREIGWFFYNFNWDGGLVSKNLMLNQTEDLFSGHFFHMQYSGRGVNVSENILYNVKNITAVNLSALEAGNPEREGFVFQNNSFDVENSYIVNAESINDISGYSFQSNKYNSTKTNDTWFRFNSSTKTNAEWISLTGDNSAFEQKSFSDSSRNIETYMSYIGETPSVDNFLDKCKNQGRYNWDNKFSAENVNDYIRTGFDLEDDVSAPNSPEGLNVL